MASSYLLSLGAEFDLIINIDGFNETVLSVLDNSNHQTSISDPRAWHARALSMIDPRSTADAARLLNLRGNRQQMARNMCRIQNRSALRNGISASIQQE